MGFRKYFLFSICPSYNWSNSKALSHFSKDAYYIRSFHATTQPNSKFSYVPILPSLESKTRPVGIHWFRSTSFISFLHGHCGPSRICPGQCHKHFHFIPIRDIAFITGFSFWNLQRDHLHDTLQWLTNSTSWEKLGWCNHMDSS